MAEWSVPGFTGVRMLGSGGFGEVVLARHDASGTLVAIKYLRPSPLADAGFTRLFRGEAAAGTGHVRPRDLHREAAARRGGRRSG
jgi:serine/threonine protein kinase